MKTGTPDARGGAGTGHGAPPETTPRTRTLASAAFMLGVLVFGLSGYLLTPSVSAPRERMFTIRARQYGYTPEVLRVNRGDTIRLRFVSEDVVHGFYLEGYDLDVTMVPMRTAVERRWPSRPGVRDTVEEVVLTADRPGKFRFRCSQSCGFLHPFMLGEMVVSPNRLFWTGLFLAAGILVGGGAAVLLAERSR